MGLASESGGPICYASHDVMGGAPNNSPPWLPVRLMVHDCRPCVTTHTRGVFGRSPKSGAEGRSIEENVDHKEDTEGTVDSRFLSMSKYVQVGPANGKALSPTGRFRQIKSE